MIFVYLLKLEHLNLLNFEFQTDLKDCLCRYNFEYLEDVYIKF